MFKKYKLKRQIELGILEKQLTCNHKFKTVATVITYNSGFNLLSFIFFGSPRLHLDSIKMVCCKCGYEKPIRINLL